MTAYEAMAIIVIILAGIATEAALERRSRSKRNPKTYEGEV